MLKLEKTSHFSGLRVRLRERERFFEPRLLKALAMALIFHSGALLLFHVAPFDLSSTFRFPPVQVNSILDQQQGISVTALVHPEENEEILSPPFSIIPALDWNFFSQNSTLISTPHLDTYTFQSLEEHLWPKWYEPLSLRLEEPYIQLIISGDLADLSLIASDPLLNQMQPFSPSLSPVYVTYQVQMDEKTGELFWYERIESSGIEAVDRKTEKILKNLRFAIREPLELVSGSLNFIVFTPIP